MLEKYDTDLRSCSTPAVAWAVNQWCDPVPDTEVFDKSKYEMSYRVLVVLPTIDIVYAVPVVILVIPSP